MTAHLLLKIAILAGIGLTASMVVTNYTDDRSVSVVRTLTGIVSFVSGLALLACTILYLLSW